MNRTTYKYGVFILKNDSKIPAELIQDYEKRKLILNFQDKKYEIAFNENWFLTLRKLDKISNKEGYKILCNGTSKYVGVAGFIINMADGTSCYYKDPNNKNEKNKLKTVQTLSYSYWNEYATEKEQRVSFFGKEFVEATDKGWDAVMKEIRKEKKQNKNEKAQ
ncbi:hypothetical protein HYV85_02965 [Candidatus Woesearchaeota archaeon]|nr:hypothetical protein [Candidatus Woesearchaeota archaeon]